MRALWLVPALPLIGFVLLAFVGRRLSARLVAVIGVGSVGLSAVAAFAIAARLLQMEPADRVYRLVLWSWFTLDSVSAQVALYLDPLSLVMTLIVTGVGFLIHVYSAGFMHGDPGYSRFFAYMNLFVAAMLVLVLADNLLLLYLGWEGVGLCSYLLIGFWYASPENGYAARKAFVVTRVGDTALLIGVLVIISALGSANIPAVIALADATWPAGSTIAVITAALLLGGAVGKSAQLPLQVWLPDAMAGPTPVSALIHAATMVTAGVYLIARLHPLFQLAPPVLFAVGAIGAATLLIAGASALAQNDIKRVLAYSTISQIGYMFLALGVGAWSAAIFHLMTHAFFKALLFLAAGLVIHALNHEHDIYKMGDLRKRLPIAFWGFGIGAASLAALPLVTAGFYSKDLILLHAWAGPNGNAWLWFAGWLGAILTGLYIFRAFFIAFFGTARTAVTAPVGYVMTLPVMVLALLSIVGGSVELPPLLGHFTIFSDLLSPALAASKVTVSANIELRIETLSVFAAVFGLYLAWRWYYPARATPATALIALLRSGFGFDTLYARAVIQPFNALTRSLHGDVFDNGVRALTDLSRAAHAALSHTQSGQLRWYAAGLAAGAVLITAMALLP